MNRTTRLLAAGPVGALAAGAVGYAVGGVEGAGTGAIAFALAVAVVGGLLAVVGASVGRPAETNVALALGGAVSVVVWAVFATSVLEPGLPLWGFVGAVSLVGALLGSVCGSPADGLWHATLGCGGGGVLFVYHTVYVSFTMQPELWGFVVIAAIVAPLGFGVAGGVGGALAAFAFDAVAAVRASE